MIVTPKDKRYRVNEIFYSIQGEGRRAGEASVFVRFSGCNLKCSLKKSDISPGFFNCDTEYTSGEEMSYEQVMDAVDAIARDCRWIVLTGGEPALQVDKYLVAAAHDRGYKVAVETNGTRELPKHIDWVTVSPKTAEHTILVRKCDEVKYLRAAGMAIPKTSITADHYLISPVFDAGELSEADLTHCIELVKNNPRWKLSVQQHNFWRLR
jgi:7-carboxy-7-deazaguanine synthase